MKATFVPQKWNHLGDSNRETHAWLHTIEKEGNVLLCFQSPARKDTFYIFVWFILFFWYNISFIDPPLGRFGEILQNKLMLENMQYISRVNKDILVNTRNKFHISAHPCIILYIVFMLLEIFQMKPRYIFIGRSLVRIMRGRGGAI